MHNIISRQQVLGLTFFYIHFQFQLNSSRVPLVTTKMGVSVQLQRIQSEKVRIVITFLIEHRLRGDQRCIKSALKCMGKELKVSGGIWLKTNLISTTQKKLKQNRQGNFKIHVHSFNYFFIIFIFTLLSIPRTNITGFLN